MRRKLEALGETKDMKQSNEIKINQIQSGKSTKTGGFHIITPSAQV